MNEHQDVWSGLPIGEPRGLKAWRDDVALKVLAAPLNHFDKGRVRVRLPSGRTAVFGAGSPIAHIDVRRFRAVYSSLRRGLLGFAENYMSGHIDTPELREVFRVYHDNYAELSRSAPRFLRPRLLDRLLHRRRSNTRSGSRRNIAAHYDLGNDFYRAWLDPGMTYSSGIYTSPEMSLEAAQEEKYRAILAALAAPAEARVLEIGCGWGGMAERLAQAGASVTAITISAEQEAWARTRISEVGLSSKVDVRFQDYRDVGGTFDRVVSVEMIEAVGEEHWETYFRVLAERMRSGGSAIVQAITIADEHFEDYRSRPDFIQRYIFPGGMLPTVSVMRELARNAGLGFETVQTFGASYARTLTDWHDRFNAAWPRIANLGFDARFRRMWEFYLAYCEVGFERGCIDVGLYRLSKP